jgi:uncharacterized membrane protein YoaK (UPF0700 family)
MNRRETLGAATSFALGALLSMLAQSAYPEFTLAFIAASILFMLVALGLYAVHATQVLEDVLDADDRADAF